MERYGWAFFEWQNAVLASESWARFVREGRAQARVRKTPPAPGGQTWELEVIYDGRVA